MSGPTPAICREALEYKATEVPVWCGANNDKSTATKSGGNIKAGEDGGRWLFIDMTLFE